MISNFKTLYALDISNYISKKPVFRYDKSLGKSVDTGNRLDYLSWPDVVVLLHENGAETVMYGTENGQNGHSLHLSDGNLPEVHVWVEVDGDRRFITYPVIDGTKDISMDKLAQSDVHNATQRGFVKCVAVNWGLGLSLWMKEEKKAAETVKPTEIPLNERLRNKANIAAKKLGGSAYLPDSIGYSDREIKKLLGEAAKLVELEAALDKVIG